MNEMKAYVGKLYEAKPSNNHRIKGNRIKERMFFRVKKIKYLFLSYLEYDYLTSSGLK